MRVALLGLALCLGCAPAPAASPNVLLFLADDQGWNGTSVAMDDRVAGSRSDFYQTPASSAPGRARASPRPTRRLPCARPRGRAS